jgi:hypothetical protein
LVLLLREREELEGHGELEGQDYEKTRGGIGYVIDLRGSFDI